MFQFDAKFAIEAIKNHVPTTVGHTEYINEATARLTGSRVDDKKGSAVPAGRTPDDKKEATKLAVETVKVLVTIAVAVLVATGAFVQFARNSGVEWESATMLLFAGSALLLLVSIGSGLSAISTVYKHAEGRSPADQAKEPWSTEPIRTTLNVQAWVGLGALSLLLAGLVVSANEGKIRTATLAISFPTGNANPPAEFKLPCGPVVVEGQWTELSFKTNSKQEIKVPQGASMINLICK